MSDRLVRQTENVRAVAERLACIIAVAAHSPWEIIEVDTELHDELRDIAQLVAHTIHVGDYDEYKLAIACIVAVPGAIAGGREKWTLSDIAGDIIWRVNRDVIKKDIRADVDEFLNELFPS